MSIAELVLICCAIKANLVLNADYFAKEYRIPQAAFHALILVESSYNEKAISPKVVRKGKLMPRSYGLTQLTLATAKRFCNLSRRNILDPMKNLECGAKVFQYQYQRYGGNLDKALSAYNAGTYTPYNKKYVVDVKQRISEIFKAREIDVD